MKLISPHKLKNHSRWTLTRKTELCRYIVQSPEHGIKVALSYGFSSEEINRMVEKFRNIGMVGLRVCKIHRKTKV